MRCFPTSVSPSSVRGHISKTKHDRHIVTMKHYIEVSTADSVAAFGSSLNCPVGGNLFQIKICSNINAASRSTLLQTTAVVNDARPSSHRRCFAGNLLFTIIVRCVDDAKVEQEASQLLYSGSAIFLSAVHLTKIFVQIINLNCYN